MKLLQPHKSRGFRYTESGNAVKLPTRYFPGPVDHPDFHLIEVFDMQTREIFGLGKIPTESLSQPQILQLYKQMEHRQMIRHPIIECVHDFWHDPFQHGLMYVVDQNDEKNAKKTLQDMIEEPNASWDLVQIQFFCRQMLDILTFLHHPTTLSDRPPMIHGGLDPSGIFVNKDGYTIEKMQLLPPMVWNRTSNFVAPERDSSECDERVDSFSLGLCVLEMVMGDGFLSGKIQKAIKKNEEKGRKEIDKHIHQISYAPLRQFLESCLGIQSSHRLSARDLRRLPFLDWYRPLSKQPMCVSELQAYQFEHDRVVTQYHMVVSNWMRQSGVASRGRDIVSIVLDMVSFLPCTHAKYTIVLKEAMPIDDGVRMILDIRSKRGLKRVGGPRHGQIITFTLRYNDDVDAVVRELMADIRKHWSGGDEIALKAVLSWKSIKEKILMS